ncbi:MAG: hypothetical protein WA632_03735 [Gallionella sp.]
MPQADREPCPACGIYVFKWVDTRRDSNATHTGRLEKAYPGFESGSPGSILQPLETLDAMSFYGRIAALILLAAWSWFLFGYDYRYGEINGSFMHNILLPVHEAGHVLFMPFGEFMMILGGSLFQLALPITIGVAFIVKQRDNFGAAISAWWASVSLIDLSPYIYDALHPQLTLVGGGTGETRPHDWIYLLSTMGQLRNAQFWGGAAHACGGLLMIGALTWAGVVLWRSREHLDQQMKWRD